VGDAASIGGAEVAMLQGERVAREVDAYLEDHQRSETLIESWVLRRQRWMRSFIDEAFPSTAQFQLPENDIVVCRCEEVTAGEIRTVTERGCMGPNQGKAFTRCGMGPCMGRKCGLTVSRLMAQVRGVSVQEVGHYRIRSPIRPITVGQLADMESSLNGDNQSLLSADSS
jgi:NAD(P)H-nitrite reductase large subunit